MNLAEYIKDQGDQQVADNLEVSVRTVASWRRGERFPSSLAIRQLVKGSGGRLTYAEVYDDYSP